MPTEGLLTRLAEAVSMCSACALGARGKGVPGRWVMPDNMPHHNEGTSSQQPGTLPGSAQPTVPSCPVCCHPADHSCGEPTPPSQEGGPTFEPSQGGAQADKSVSPLPISLRNPPLPDTEGLGADALVGEQLSSPDMTSGGKTHSIDREGYQSDVGGTEYRDECLSCHNCNTNRLDCLSIDDADVAVSVAPADLVMVLGEAPGAVEQERGKPFVGQSGELLHAMFKECGLTSYFVSNIAKHQPYRDRHGKQQAPSKVEIEACAPFLRAEFELIQPAKLILLGKTAAKLVAPGNFSMKEVVNQTFRCKKWSLIPTLVLYHPAYFLRQRTAPWIQKQIRDWKSAVRLFLGAKAPTYRVEKVPCQYH